MKGRLAELIIHITNLIYFCSGVTILVFGAVALGDPAAIVSLFNYIPGYNELSQVMQLNGVTEGPAIYLVVAGSLVIILSLVGCGGIFKKHHPIIIAYSVLTLLMMLFDLAVIIYYAVDPYNVQNNVQSSMNYTLRNSFQPVSISTSGDITLPSDSSANAWVTMQFQQGCCGVAGYQDYETFSWDRNFSSIGVYNAVIPPSCCTQLQQYQNATNIAQFTNLTGCMTSATHPPYYANWQGCSSYILEIVYQYNFVYVIVAAGLTAMQAILVALSFHVLTIHLKVDII